VKGTNYHEFAQGSDDESYNERKLYDGLFRLSEFKATLLFEE